MGKKCRFYVDIMAMHEEVTGSCNLAIVKFPNGETLRFVTDCGLFQERKYDELNNALPFDPEKVDFCLITHTHVDHIGRLPYMVKKGFYRSIYVTETTNKLLPLALNDSFKVLSSVSKRKNVKCLYSEADVDKTLSLLKPCRYNETIRVNDNVKITFLNNGHLVGAALILVQISYPEYEDINLLFTGDYNNKNMFFDVNPIPKWILELPLTVIQESTYGDMDSTEIKEIFKENIKKCIESDGTVLTLVFSLGRAQEILYELKCMQENCQLVILGTGDGYYDVKSTDGITIVASGASFGSSESKVFSVNFLSNETFETLNDVYVFPNPTKSILNIAVPSGVEMIKNVAVYNYLGQVVAQKNITNQDDLSIDTTNFSNGVYLITVSNGAQSKTLRFIKE